MYTGSPAERRNIMKKIIAFILIAVMALSLTGCYGLTGSSAQEETYDPKEASAYEQSFDGLKQYLIEHSLVSKNNASEVYYDILGADDGVRYILSNTAFIELYDFSKADNETAKTVLADVADDGKLTAIDGLDELSGVISNSGKYLALYKEKDSGKCSDITAELAEW